MISRFRILNFRELNEFETLEFYSFEFKNIAQECIIKVLPVGKDKSNTMPIVIVTAYVASSYKDIHHIINWAFRNGVCPQ